MVGDTGEGGTRLMGKPTEGTKASDLYATICAGLDIDHEKENFTPEERPIRVVEEGGTPIKALVG